MIVLAFIYANADWWLDQLQSGLNQRLRVMALIIPALFMVAGRRLAGIAAGSLWRPGCDAVLPANRVFFALSADC